MLRRTAALGGALPFVILSLVGALAGCASSGAAAGATASGPATAVAPTPRAAGATTAAAPIAGAASATSRAAKPPAKGNSNLIVASEIAGTGVSDAFQAVKLLRPAMLRGRNGSLNDNSGGAELVVYVDGVKAGGPQSLESVTALAISEIRFISAADATTRFGTGHPLGAILVVTKR